MPVFSVDFYFFYFGFLTILMIFEILNSEFKRRNIDTNAIGSGKEKKRRQNRGASGQELNQNCQHSSSFAFCYNKRNNFA